MMEDDGLRVFGAQILVEDVGSVFVVIVLMAAGPSFGVMVVWLLALPSITAEAHKGRSPHKTAAPRRLWHGKGRGMVFSWQISCFCDIYPQTAGFRAVRILSVCCFCLILR